MKLLVRDKNGKPISGSSIASTAQPSGQQALVGSADSNGVVTFIDVLSGNYTVQAQKSGYTSSTYKANVKAGSVNEVALTQNLILGDLLVTTVSDVGGAVSGASVSSTSTPNEQPALRGSSDNDGSVRFNGLIPGSYTIQASKDGFYSALGTVSVTPGSVTGITLILRVVPTTGALRITVKDSSGAAVQGAVVSSKSQPSGQPLLSGTTGADGTTTFSDVLPGSYTVQASKGGYASLSGVGNVVVGSTAETTITLQAQPSGIPGYSLEAILFGILLFLVIVMGKSKR